MDDSSRSSLLTMPSWRRLAPWFVGLVLALACIFAFIELAGVVRTERGGFDRPMVEALHRRVAPWLTVALWIVSACGSTPAATGVTAALGIYWWRWASWRAERATGWSFPSGHTLSAVIQGGLLAWLIGRRLNAW
jgi:hypothetical protein